MKKITVFALLSMIIMFGCAVPEKAPVEELTMVRIVGVPGYTKNQLFDKSKMWLAENLYLHRM